MIAFLDLIDNAEQRSFCEELYVKHRSEMLKLAMSELDDAAEAEDIVHDVFVYVAKNSIGRLSRFSDAEIRFYLLIAARHRAINRRRKLDRLLPLDSPSQKIRPELADRSVFGILEQRESEAEAKALLSGLSPIYRDVMYLRYVQQLSGREIAGLLSIKESAVFKRIVRGKKLLAERLGREESK